MVFFEIMGILACLVIVSSLAVVAVYAIKESILNTKHKHAYKHRFDKPPLAKCYCIDCKHYRENGDCNAHNGWKVADNWFCWCAFPRKRNP